MVCGASKFPGVLLLWVILTDRFTEMEHHGCVFSLFLFIWSGERNIGHEKGTQLCCSPCNGEDQAIDQAFIFQRNKENRHTLSLMHCHHRCVLLELPRADAL